MGLCWGRTKSSASSQGGHPSPSRSLFHAFPPFLRGRGAGGDCPLFEPAPVRGLDTFVSLSLVRFSSFCPLALHLLWGVPLFSVVADFSVIRGNDSRQRISRLLLR